MYLWLIVFFALQIWVEVKLGAAEEKQLVKVTKAVLVNKDLALK